MVVRWGVVLTSSDGTFYVAHYCHMRQVPTVKLDPRVVNHDPATFTAYVRKG